MRASVLILLLFLTNPVWSQSDKKIDFDPAAALRKIAEEETKGKFTDDQLIKQYKKIADKCVGSQQEFEKLNALYKVMTIAANHEKNRTVMLDAADKSYHILKAKMTTGDLPLNNEKGKFYRESMRISSNTIAWYSQMNTENGPELEHLLEVISTGCQYVEDPSHFFMLDTKIRILLKLGRIDEAYHIVYDCLKADKYFSDLDDIKRDRAYIEWRNKNYPVNQIEFSDQEKQLLAKARRIHQRLVSEIGSDSLKVTFSQKNPPEYKIMLLSEAKKKYGFTGDFHQEADHDILVIQGDVILNSNLDASWIEESVKKIKASGYVAGVLITGNLFIQGDLIDDDYVHLRVMKNLWCDYLFSYNGTIVVDGDARIKVGVYGEYNDGYLRINGKLYTPYIIADDHDMPREAEGSFIYIEGGNGTYRDEILLGNAKGSGYGWDWDYLEDAGKLFNPKVWDEEDGFSESRFFDLVQKGENPFATFE